MRARWAGGAECGSCHILEWDKAKSEQDRRGTLIDFSRVSLEFGKPNGAGESGSRSIAVLYLLLLSL